MATINGSVGNDTLFGTFENDTINGFDGSDVLVLPGLSEQYSIARFSDKAVVTSYTIPTDGTDNLYSVEWVQFADKKVRIKQPIWLDNAIVVSEIDGGNTFASAQTVNSLQPTKISGTISSSTDRDWYRIDLSEPSDIELSLENQTAGLSMRLWNDFNNNGKVDSGEFHTNYQSNDANEYIFRSDRWAGTWYAEVWRTSGATTGTYTLGMAVKPSVGNSPSIGKNLGSIAVGQTINAMGAIGELDREDWYKFTITNRQKFTASLDYADDYGSAWVEVFDSSMQRVAIADTDSVDEELVKVLDAGNYYLKLFDHQGSSQRNYNLNLKAENPFLSGYFFERNTGNFKGIKETSSLGFDWGNGGEFGLTDNFQATWYGSITPNISGQYTFYAGSDDGSRIYLNGEKIVNNWADQGYTERSTTVNLIAGQSYSVQFDYYEAGGGAKVTFDWAGPGFTKKAFDINDFNSKALPGLKAEYYNGINFDSLVGERIETPFFDWGGGSPMTGVNADNFSIRWTGKIKLDSDTTLTTLSDDGVRIWIDGNLAIDNWTYHSPTYNYSPTISAGTHNIKIEYFDGGGNALLQLFDRNLQQIPLHFFDV